MQHYIDYLINKEKLLSAEEFNSKIKNAKLSSRDARNRPKPFKTRAKNSKYEGNAGSLRVLSRILTTILTSLLDLSETGKFLVKLHEVSEIITAPKLTMYEIEEVMSQIILEYLDLRVEGITLLKMSNPRPKHHFLSHYSRSFAFHGPLIQLWAMRMEGKHVFFKNVMRSSKNFINAPFTCANRHQMAQISYAYNGLFSSSPIEIPDDSVSVSDILRINNETEMKNYYLGLNRQALVPKPLLIFGTKFQTGNVIIIKKESFGSLKVGMIRSMSFCDNEVNFAVATFIANQSKHGFYVTTKALSSCERVDFQSLLDYHPLEMIGSSKSFLFTLHHYVSAGKT